MNVSANTVLAGLALIGLIALSILFAIHAVPAENHDYLIFTLGALAGAITVGGGRALDSLAKPKADPPEGQP